jgi:uncharacterized protein
MHAKLLHQSDGQRTFAVILQTGDEAIAQIKAFADREKLSAAQFMAIGALSRAVLGYFDWDTKDYQRIPVAEQTEVASFIGDIALDKDEKRSLHVVLGRRDGSAVAVLTESPAHLRKRRDPESGLALIDPLQ